LGGDITKGDGSGSCTVYMENGTAHNVMDAEKNKLKFCEPYLLAMAANKEGQVGS
jgi:hypothetical protein